MAPASPLNSTTVAAAPRGAPADSPRPWLVSLSLCLAAWALIFFVPTGPLQSVDFIGILQPYQDFFRASLRAGELPLWNPYASLGRPFLADPQAVALWPGSLFYLLCGAPVGAWLLVSLHAAWAIHATADVARRFDAARWAALGAGWCFAFNPKLLGHAHAGHVQYVISFLTLPAVLAAFLRLREDLQPRTVARLALVVAWQLLEGAPQVFWCTGVLVAVMGIARWAAAPSSAGWRILWRAGLGAVAGYTWGFALSAIALLPMTELIGQSNRGARLAALSAVGPLALKTLPSLYTFFGDPIRLWDYEVMIYPGVLLAVMGVAGLGLWYLRAARALALATATIVFLAVAPGTGLHQWLVDFLPGYSSFRLHARWGVALGWLLALSAAVFASAQEKRGWRRLTLGLAGLFGLALLLSLFPSPVLDAGAPSTDWALLPAGFLLAAMAAGYWTTRVDAGGNSPGRAPIIFAALIAAELLVVLMFYKNGYPQDRVRRLEEKIVPALTQAGLRRAGQPPPRAYLPISVAHNNAGMRLGYSSLFGYESLVLARARSVSHWAIGAEPPNYTDFPSFVDFDARLPWPVRGFGLQLGYDPHAKTLVTQATPDLPRAWLTGSVAVETDWRQAGRRTAALASAQTTAVLETPDVRIAGLRPGAPGEIAFTEFGLNHVTLKVRAAQPQLLVLAEPWYPGWRVLVNGTAEDALPANGWMRAAFVPAGESVVEFRYRSRWLALGAFVSLAALAAAGVAEWRGARNRPRASPGKIA